MNANSPERRLEALPRARRAAARGAAPAVSSTVDAPGEARPAEHLVSLVAPNAYAAEQYRILRHAIEQRHQTSGLRAVAVTSPGGGDGKTTTAINLAGALAQAPAARVLLMEADLRRPSILQQLGLAQPAAGLAEAAVDAAATLEAITLRLGPFNLHVVPAGRPSMAPYELLRTARVAELLAQARAEYDFVVLDTPPVLPCPDYRVLEPRVDGAILVVAADRTPRETVDGALELLDPRKTLGVVFNGERQALARYHGYYNSEDAPSLRTRLRWPRRSR